MDTSKTQNEIAEQILLLENHEFTLKNQLKETRNQIERLKSQRYHSQVKKVNYYYLPMHFD